MRLSISKTKNKGGRPRVDAVPVMVRMPPDLLAALDAHIAESDFSPTRPEALRAITRDWLIGHGYLKHREDPEGAN